MRNIFTILLIGPAILFAQQKPFINNITPTTVEVGGKVSISGSNLTNVTQVTFGGVSVSGGNINVVSDNLVEATVPAGATHGSVLVRTSNNLVAESSEQFFISFSSNASSTWKAEYLESISPKKNVYDICLCDLNADGLNDVIMTHNLSNETGVEATVFENQSTPAAEAFNDIGLTDNNENSIGGFISTTCADLDNDGDKDVIFTTDNTTNIKQIYVYRNNENGGGGSVSLTYFNALNLSLPTIGGGDKRVPRRIRASDIDGDGKLDLVVGNENDNTIHIFPNTTTTANSFSFGSPVEITVGNAATTGGIDVGDLDNDGKPDVVVIPAVQSNEQIYVLRNQSQPGTFTMSLQEGITRSDQRRNVIIGDFDNDGLNDIAATADATISGVTNNETVTVYKNTTSGQDITFTTEQSIIIPANLPWGLDAGDVNGDGRLDIVVAALGVSTGAIYVIENSASGNMSFGTPILLSTNADARNVYVGDISGDGKPDITYTHDTRAGSQGDLGVRVNQTCIEPVINPAAYTFCPNTNFTLSATNVANGTYSWSLGTGTTGTVVSQSGNQATFNITSSADATINLQITGQAGCSAPPTTSYTANFEAGAVTPTPSITVNDADGLPICAGDNVTLGTSTTFDEYLWTLPDGSTSTTATIAINSAGASNAGEYQLTVRNSGSCNSPLVTQNLSVSVPPELEILNSNLDNFCSNTSVTLEVSDYSSDFNYQWYQNGTSITGETGTSISANTSGDYRVDIINATDGCVSQSANYTITAVAPPTSISDGPTEICTNTAASFTSASTGQGSFTLEYAWTIEDASNAVIHTATTPNLDFTFTTAGDYEVILATTYDDTEVFNGDNCEGTTSINITVSDPPVATINQAAVVEKCQADVIQVGLSAPAAGTIDTYSWTVINPADNSVIETGSNETIEVATPVGVGSVQVSVDIATSIGCTVTSNTIEVRNFQSDVDISSTDFTSVVDFDSALLENAVSINLSANNAASNISWEPAENFSDPTGTNTIFFPQNPVTTVTLNATDNNGCNVSTEIRVVLDNIRPKRTFSPNGDGMNDCWEVLNIGELGNENGCKVFVFDSRGRNILVRENFEANNNCVWDGNFNSSPVPEGVYYYVLKCDASEFTKSGSILLAR